MNVNSPIRKILNWIITYPLRAITILIVLLIVIIGSMGGYLWHSASQQFYAHKPVPTAMPTVSSPWDLIPTPGPQRTTYTNTTYHYSFVYPSTWKVRELTDQGADVVQGIYPVPIGDLAPFEISCSANPQGLKPVDFWNWKQKQKQYTPEQSVGTITLPGGQRVFVSTGHGQTGYVVYTFTHTTSACQFVAFPSNKTNEDLVWTVLTTFKWH